MTPGGNEMSEEVCGWCGGPRALHDGMCGAEKDALNQAWNEELQQQMWAEYEQTERDAGRL